MYALIAFQEVSERTGKGVVVMSVLLGGLSEIITIIGVLAFITSCITEVLKQWKWYDRKVPTEMSAVLVSMVVTPATLIRMAAYYNVVIDWYACFACVIAAFIVALVSMSGWERVMDIFDRFMEKGRGR